MFEFFKKHKHKISKSMGSDNFLEESFLTGDFNIDIRTIKELFDNNDTLIIRNFENSLGKTKRFCIMYINGMVNNTIINENVIRPVQSMEITKGRHDIIDVLINKILRINDAEKTSKMSKIVEAVVSGDTVLFAEDSDQAIVLNTKGYVLRAVVEPESEKILRGPREGFTEGLLINLSMLMRRIATQDLKMKFRFFGERTKTKACICYIDGLVSQKILDELNKRLDKFSLDGALDTNYIAEIIKDSPLSPFKTIGNTERPDIVAAKLLEGRIAIFLNGTPAILTLPYLFIENFQSNEDYFVNYYYATISRIVRIVGYIITVALPAFYVAVVAYHPEMLPTPLLISIARARADVPFTTVVETFLMLFVFITLAETGIRMPVGIGNALSIVGALVIGQAAVDAKIFSAPVIIIVAFTGVTALINPRLNASILVFRILLLLLASMLGLFGMMCGAVGILIHLFNIRSFGVPFMSAISFTDFQKSKDIMIRAPWWKMILRPDFAKDKTRMKTGGNQQ